MATEPMHVTATEARMLENLSPAALWDLNQTKKAAEAEAKARFLRKNGPNDTADNHTDAFRHGVLERVDDYKDLARAWTRDSATAHERLPGNPPPPKQWTCAQQRGRQKHRHGPSRSHTGGARRPRRTSSQQR